MNRFMIGMYGRFDEGKLLRDFRDGFYGVEACLFPGEADIRRLAEAAKRQRFRVGVHYPLRAGMSPHRDALFMAKDDAVRAAAFAAIDAELAFASEWLQPDYMLFHYPKPVLLDGRADWSQWRFASAAEFAGESEYTPEQFQLLSEELFAWLSAKGSEYGITPVFELDALHRYVYETTLLESLLTRYPTVKLCLDTGRLYMQAMSDPHFDALAAIGKFARYADAVHLANVQYREGNVERRHYPALPGLRTDEGWAPIEAYLQLIAMYNPHVRIMFEHRSELVSDEELQACYEWVNQRLGED